MGSPSTMSFGPGRGGSCGIDGSDTPCGGATGHNGNWSIDARLLPDRGDKDRLRADAIKGGDEEDGRVGREVLGFVLGKAGDLVGARLGRRRKEDRNRRLGTGPLQVASQLCLHAPRCHRGKVDLEPRPLLFAPVREREGAVGHENSSLLAGLPIAGTRLGDDDGMPAKLDLGGKVEELHSGVSCARKLQGKADVDRGEVVLGKEGGINRVRGSLDSGKWQTTGRRDETACHLARDDEGLARANTRG